MKKLKASTMLATAALGLGLATAGIGMAHAGTSTSGTNPMSNLVSAIATKFNLNQVDVQQVFDEQHAQMETQRLEDQKNRLAQLVTDGKLTQEQVDKIVAKQQELQSQREATRTAMEGKTIAERKTAMEQQRAALQQWATESNIPMQYLHFGIGKGHGGPGHRGGFDERPANIAPSDTITQAN